MGRGSYKASLPTTLKWKLLPWKGGIQQMGSNPNLACVFPATFVDFPKGAFAHQLYHMVILHSHSGQLRVYWRRSCTRWLGRLPLLFFTQISTFVQSYYYDHPQLQARFASPFSSKIKTLKPKPAAVSRPIFHDGEVVCLLHPPQAQCGRQLRVCSTKTPPVNKKTHWSPFPTPFFSSSSSTMQREDVEQKGGGNGLLQTTNKRARTRRSSRVCKKGRRKQAAHHKWRDCCFCQRMQRWV